MRTNKAFRQILGYSEYELSELKWQEITHPDDVQKNVDQLETIITGEKPSARFEKRYIHKGGSIVWADVSTILQRDSEGNPLYFITTIQDITERKLVEEALRKSEEDYRRLFENHSAIKLVIDPETGDIHDANYAAAAYYGWSREKMKTMNITRINLKTSEEIKSLMKQVKTQQKDHFESKHLRADGTTRDVEVFSNCINMEDREYLHSIVMDITERKHAEEEIKTLNQRLQLLVIAIQELSIAPDMKSIMATVRTSARQLVNASGSTFVLRDGDKCFYADEDAILPLWKGQRFPMSACVSGWAMENKQSVIIEDIYKDSRIPIAAYQQTFVKSLTMVPIRNNDPLGAIGAYWSDNYTPTPIEVQLLQTLADATARAVENVQFVENLEQRVEQRTEQLEAANKELEAFSYSVSHDLRAPLRHINGFISLFLENKKTDLPDEELGYLNIVSQSAKEMGDLIDALLSFSRLSRTEIQRTKINPQLLVNQLLDMFSEEIKRRKIELIVPEMPFIHGDYQLIRQVWTNLLSNAIKYTAKKETAKIEIGSYEQDLETVYFVKDNGAGFNMKYGNKLFGVFQRLHKPRDFEGIGIGLANVNRIISRHGGRCWANGEIDLGATFYFSLPNHNG